jgi:hypothetical protein
MAKSIPVQTTPAGNKFDLYDTGEGTPDRYTFVMHGEDWDSSANPGFKMMLGWNWGEGHDGPHLGKKILASELPPGELAQFYHRIDVE